MQFIYTSRITDEPDRDECSLCESAAKVPSALAFLAQAAEEQGEYLNVRVTYGLIHLSIETYFDDDDSTVPVLVPPLEMDDCPF
jgi:hypothetical protein